MASNQQVIWLAQFWSKPATVFQQVVTTKGSWVLPLMLIVFAMVGSRIFYYQVEDPVYVFATANQMEMIDAQLAIEEMTEQEQQNLVANARSNWMWMLFWLVPTLFCLSYFGFMGERFISKTRHTMGQWFAVTLWCWLPLVIGAIAYSINFALASESATTTSLDPFKFVNHIPAIVNDPSLYMWFSKFSMMHVFALMYQLIAFKVLTEKSWNVVILIWMISIPATVACSAFIEIV